MILLLDVFWLKDTLGFTDAAQLAVLFPNAVLILCDATGISLMRLVLVVLVFTYTIFNTFNNHLTCHLKE